MASKTTISWFVRLWGLIRAGIKGEYRGKIHCRGQHPLERGIERTVGYEIGGIGSGVELCNGVPADLAARCAIMTIAILRLHQHRDIGLVLDHQLQHLLVEVRAMVPTIAMGDVHDLFVRRLSAVIAAIDMKTRRIEMVEPARQPQPRGRRGGNEAIECCHPKVVEGIEGAPEGVIIEMAGLNAWGNEARDGLILEKMGHEVELLVDKTQTVEHHGFDRMAGGYNPHGRVLLGGSINDCGDAEFFKHARDQTHVI